MDRKTTVIRTYHLLVDLWKRLTTKGRRPDKLTKVIYN